MSDDLPAGADVEWALRDYTLHSGQLMVVAVDRNGLITWANRAFRAQLAAFDAARGTRLDQLLDLSQAPDVLRDSLPERIPVPLVLHELASDTPFMFYRYAVGEETLLIGDAADGADLQIIERMSSISSLMLRLASQLRQANRSLSDSNERHIEQSRTDPLTRLPNRRYFEQRFDTAFRHAQSRGESLSLLFVDLDHFKRINDRYGHSRGDEVLIAVADLLRAVLRVGDLAGRYGGEEFTVLLPGSDLASARVVAERICAGMRALLPLGASQPVSLSVGVAELADDESPQALLQRADALLYQAKREGRNRVVAG